MGGASGGPERREGDGVGRIVIDMVSGCGNPPGHAKTIAVLINTMIPLEHRTGRSRSWTSSVGCIVFFPDRFLVVVIHFVHSLPFTRCYWVRTARVVNYLVSFEDLVLIEACGMDIHS
jgi:hypothetical protein